MFRLQPHLDELYQGTRRQFAFDVEHATEMGSWQADFRAALMDLLHLSGRDLPLAPAVQLLSAADKGRYIEEKYALEADEGVFIPMYLLVPKTPPPHRPIFALHGHGPGVSTILGNHTDAVTAQARAANDDNFAQQLAQEGYFVCAIEQRGFGERITRQVGESGNACRHLAFEYMMEGRSLLGERVRDAMIAISYLQNRHGLTSNLGCVGFSGGGTTALFLAALDERITTSVIGGYFCTYKRSILGVPHCECNYVPGLLQLGEAGDIGALIAPRPVRIISGEQDPIFPIEGVYEQYATLERAYAILDAEDKCSLAIHAEGHRYQHSLGVEWFAQWL